MHTVNNTSVYVLAYIVSFLNELYKFAQNVNYIVKNSLQIITTITFTILEIFLLLFSSCKTAYFYIYIMQPMTIGGYPVCWRIIKLSP